MQGVFTMKTLVVPTYTVQITMGGDIEYAKQLLRIESYPPNEGLCVTIEPTTFIYTGGEEAGFVIRLVNYPRLPSRPEEIWERAKHIAERLILSLCQWTALLIAPDKTEWLNARPDDQR